MAEVRCRRTAAGATPLPASAGSGNGGSKAAATGRPGFALIELLAVLVVIGVLSALIVGVARYARRSGREGRASAEMGKLDNALQEHMLHFGVYPDSLLALTNRLPHDFPRDPDTGLPVDPWGQAYVYSRTTPYAYELGSRGPDGTNGTPDDVR
jgi:type II secretion system protein G